MLQWSKVTKFSTRPYLNFPTKFFPCTENEPPTKSFDLDSNLFEASKETQSSGVKVTSRTTHDFMTPTRWKFGGQVKPVLDEKR